MINEVTKILENNNVYPELIESIHNMLVKFVREKRGCPSCCNYVSQKSPNNTTRCFEHDRNRKRLENNDQISIQIGKGLKVSSIRIEFDQEKPVRQNRSLLNSF
jgi:hypothetical protein